MTSYGKDLHADYLQCADVACDKVGSATCTVKAASVDASGAVSAASVAATGAVSGASVSASAHLNVGTLSAGPGATTPASGSAGDLWVVYGNDGTTYEESSNGLYVYNGTNWVQAAQMNESKV